MNPRRLHSETIFSINSADFASAIGGAVFLKRSAMSRWAGRRKRAAKSRENRAMLCAQIPYILRLTFDCA